MQNSDYLLTLNTSIIKGSIPVDGHRILVEDLNHKMTFVNIFSTLYELSDEVITEHLQVYSKIISERRGHYVTHLEVENAIHHWQMLLHRPIPSGAGQADCQVRGSPWLLLQMWQFWTLPCSMPEFRVSLLWGGGTQGGRVAECGAKQMKSQAEEVQLLQVWGAPRQPVPYCQPRPELKGLPRSQSHGNHQPSPPPGPPPHHHQPVQLPITPPPPSPPSAIQK